MCAYFYSFYAVADTSKSSLPSIHKAASSNHQARALRSTLITRGPMRIPKRVPIQNVPQLNPPVCPGTGQDQVFGIAPQISSGPLEAADLTLVPAKVMDRALGGPDVPVSQESVGRARADDAGAVGIELDAVDGPVVIWASEGSARRLVVHPVFNESNGNICLFLQCDNLLRMGRGTLGWCIALELERSNPRTWLALKQGVEKV